MIDDLDAETRQLPSYEQLDRHKVLVPTLTVLYHPELERAGARVQFPGLSHAGKTVEISRRALVLRLKELELE